MKRWQQRRDIDEYDTCGQTTIGSISESMNMEAMEPRLQPLESSRDCSRS